MPSPLPPASRIWVAGHSGLAGSAIVRRLAAEGVAAPLTARHADLDLRDQAATRAFVARHRPELVFLAAATVGGILDNASRPADFLYDNLMIAANVLEACASAGTRRVVLLGSSCVYPRDAAQPIREEALLTGPLEPTNEAYAVAKIAALKLGEAFRRQRGLDVVSVMPSNLYGPGDSFDLAKSHVLPALIRKFAEAGPGGTVTVWGTGRPRREFLHADDLADAVVFLAKRDEVEGLVNVGTGTDVTIAELAEMVKRIVEPTARVEWDVTKPDGTPRKLLDVGRLSAMGWRARIGLEDGVRATWEWYREGRVLGSGC